ncbi:MAG TPA: hypothetical protein VGM10_27615 [Actinocrinis sp.]|jgi:hypothetical protein
MLGAIAALLFAIAFIIYVTQTATSLIFTPTSLMLAGLCLLALHLIGIGASWRYRSRR